MNSIRDESDRGKFTLAGGYCSRYSRSLRAHGGSIGRILDVAAGIDGARSGEDRGANLEVRVRGVRMFSRLRCRFDQMAQRRSKVDQLRKLGHHASRLVTFRSKAYQTGAGRGPRWTGKACAMHERMQRRMTVGPT